MSTTYRENVDIQSFVPLGKVPAGDTIRFADTSYVEAIKNGDFWLVMKKDPETKDDRVVLTNQKGERKKRDPETMVAVHHVVMMVKP